MSNPYIYNNYQQSYSPSMPHGSININAAGSANGHGASNNTMINGNGAINPNNLSPTFHNVPFNQGNAGFPSGYMGANVGGAYPGTGPDSAGSGTGSVASSLGSSYTNSTGLASSLNSSSSNYSFHTPRLRYYLSKSFDIEDDLEFCPDIPDTLPAGTQLSHHNHHHSPPQKKFNPYTASVFSPTTSFHNQQPHQVADQSISLSPVNNPTDSPRTHTPRMKKPLEIINPHTKMRVGSPAVVHNK